MAVLTGIPSLDEVAHDPQRLNGLDTAALAALALRANAVAGSIAAKLALAAATNGAAPQHKTTPPDDDRMLLPAEAAVLLRKKVRWIYRNASRLPFVRRVGTRQLLCSEQGIRQYLNSRTLRC